MTDGFLFPGRKRAQHTIQCPHGVTGVQRGKDKVPRFGRRDGGAHGIGVPHLAHQDHIRVLPQRGPDRFGKGGHVGVQLPLVHQTLPVGMNVLYRVFDGDDVTGAIRIDLVNQGRQRCRLAAARGARDQHQAVAKFRELLQLLRQMQLLERPEGRVQPADRQRGLPPRTKHVDPKSLTPLVCICQVKGLLLLEELSLSGLHQGQCHLLHLGG